MFFSIRNRTVGHVSDIDMSCCVKVLTEAKDSCECYSILSILPFVVPVNMELYEFLRIFGYLTSTSSYSIRIKIQQG